MATRGGASPISAAVQETPHIPQKLRVDVDDGPVAYVRVRGILDNAFDGKRLAATFHASKVIIDLGQTRRIASSAVPRWQDFVTVMTARADADMYLVEVRPHVLSQFNMLVGLQGKAKIVSFYSPYRCHGCSKEFEVLMVLPRDRAIIRDLHPPEHPCPSCGGRADMDDDPASFFGAVSKQPIFDVDHAIAAFLRSRLKYQLTSDASRLRVEKLVGGSKMSYVRISGNIDRSFPAETVARALVGQAVLDLSEAKLVDQGGVTQWRATVRTALPLISSLSLIECPPGFPERALVPEDLDERLQMLSFQVEYECGNCATRVTRTIDAEANHMALRSAAFPEVGCETCRVLMIPMPSEDLLALCRIVPRATPSPALKRFAAKCTKKRSKQLSDVLLARPSRSIPPALIKAVYAIAALVVITLGIQAIIAYQLRSTPRTVAQPQPHNTAPTQAPVDIVRPAWIISDTPASSYCHDLINHFMCVGVSSYQKNRDEAAAEANAAALEELSNAVGIRIADDTFKRKVLPLYQESRQRALGALELSVDRSNNEAYTKQLEQARLARSRAAESLRATGGTAVPAQRSDWFWEEYAVEKGTGSDFLVFVRYDVSLDSIKALAERYSASISIGDSTATTVFPGLAWRLPQVKTGAMLVHVGSTLANAGLKEQSIVTAVDDKPLVDAVQLADHLKKSPKTTMIVIKSPEENSPPLKVELH